LTEVKLKIGVERNPNNNLPRTTTRASPLYFLPPPTKIIYGSTWSAKLKEFSEKEVHIFSSLSLPSPFPSLPFPHPFQVLLASFLAAASKKSPMLTSGANKLKKTIPLSKSPTKFSLLDLLGSMSRACLRWRKIGGKELSRDQRGPYQSF
jgi:hypothetical protein